MPYISIPYEPSSGHDGFRAMFKSRNEQHLLLAQIGATGIKWNNESTTPANWNGYTPENPSPGVAVGRHVWYIDQNDEVLTMLYLKGARLCKD